MADAADLQAGRPGGAWSRLFRVLVSPGKAMAEAAEDPAVLPPYLIWMLAYAVAVVGVVLFKMDDFVAAALQQVQGADAPAEQLEAVRAMMPYIVLGTALLSLLQPWIGGLYYALLMMFFGSFTGEAGRFKQYFSVAGYAAMPAVLSTLLGAPLTLSATSLEQMQQIGFHLGVLVPEASGALFGLLRAFDLFGIWSLVLVVLGYAAIHRMPPARAAWVGVFFFVVRALTSAGVAALGGGVAGLGG